MKTTVPILLGLILLNAPLWASIPEEPVWTSFFCAATMLAVLGFFLLARKEKQLPNAEFPVSLGPVLAANLLLAAVLISIVLRLVRQHGSPALIGPMLQACGVMVSYYAVFRLSAQLGRRSRNMLYVLALGIVAGGSVSAYIGVREFLIDYGIPSLKGGRVFGPSTPDFFAGFLVMTLPLTLAMFLGAPVKHRISLLYAVATLFQLIALITTQSRFALVSLAVSGVVLFIALAMAKRGGLEFSKATRIRAAAITIAVILGAVVVGGPVLHRLQHPDQNSAQFRVLTWQGTVAMIRANAASGTGIGTYIVDYQRYAVTGFTRLAHNSYLQFAAECGLIGAIALAGCLITILVFGCRGLGARAGAGGLSGDSEMPAAPPIRPFIATFAMVDDRFLAAGLLAGFVGQVVQNVIDSDWYVFAIGFVFSAMAGLLVSLSPQGTKTESTMKPVTQRWRHAAAAIAALVLMTLGISNGFAALYDAQAKAALALPKGSGLVLARNSLGTAHRLAPWSGRYLSDRGYLVFYQGMHDPASAIPYLRRAVKLQPDSPTYQRLGTVLAAAGDRNEAIKAYSLGLHSEPNSLDLLLSIAAISPPTEALAYYRRMTEIEQGPVGQVRALGEIVEVKFARGYIMMGDLAVAERDPQTALDCFFRAERILEKYADEGGSSNTMRIGIAGGKTNKAVDQAQSDLYDHVMSELVAQFQQPVVQRHREYAEKFKALIEAAGHSGTS